MQKFTSPTPNDHLSQYGDLTSNTGCVTNSDSNPVWVDNDKMVVYNLMWNSFRVLNFGKLWLQRSSSHTTLIVKYPISRKYWTAEKFTFFASCRNSENFLS